MDARQRGRQGAAHEPARRQKQGGEEGEQQRGGERAEGADGDVRPEPAEPEPAEPAEPPYTIVRMEKDKVKKTHIHTHAHTQPAVLCFGGGGGLVFLVLPATYNSPSSSDQYTAIEPHPLLAFLFILFFSLSSLSACPVSY